MTFRTFLKNYVEELLGERTQSVKLLVRKCSDEAPQAAEAVFFLAIELGTWRRACSLSNGTWMQDEWEGLARLLSACSSSEEFYRSASLPQRYRAVLAAYEEESGRLSRRRELSKRVAARVGSRLAAAGMSAYALAKACGMNPGNVCRYVNHADPTALSWKKAVALDRYTLSLGNECSDVGPTPAQNGLPALSGA